MSTSGTWRPYSNGTYVSWSRTGVSSSGNYSDLYVEFGWGFHSSPLDRQLTNGYLSVDGGLKYSNGGNVKSYEGNFTDRDHVVWSGTCRIYHNSDGTRSFSITAGLTGYSGFRVEGSPSWTLDTIPLFPGAPTGLDVTGHDDSNPTTASFTWTAPSDVGAGLDDVQLQVSTSSGFSSTVVNWTNGAWTTSHGVTGLPKGTTLYARVRAHTSAGYGPWSSTKTFTTGTTVPGAPTGLGSSNVTGSTADTSWSAPSDTGGTAITAYHMQRALDSGFSSGLVDTDLPASPRTLQLTGLTHTTTYYMRVRATNAVGNSSYSSTMSFATVSTTPGAPTGVAVDTITPTTASVTWSDPADNGGSAITGYDVQYALDSAFTTGVVTQSSSGSPKALANLAASTAYWVRVRANNANGSGAWSTSASFRTTSGLKVGDGSDWQECDVLVGNGSTWVHCRVLVGDGSGWS